MTKKLEATWYTTQDILNRFPEDLWADVVFEIAIGITNELIETDGDYIRMTELALLRLAGYNCVGNLN
jgi:hypothetical protein